MFGVEPCICTHCEDMDKQLQAEVSVEDCGDNKLTTNEIVRLTDNLLVYEKICPYTIFEEVERQLGFTKRTCVESEYFNENREN